MSDVIPEHEEPTEEPKKDDTQDQTQPTSDWLVHMQEEWKKDNEKKREAERARGINSPDLPPPPNPNPFSALESRSQSEPKKPSE